MNHLEKVVSSMDVAVENCRILKVSWFAAVLLKCEKCGYLYSENVIHTPLPPPDVVKHLCFRCMGCGEVQEFSICIN